MRPTLWRFENPALSGVRALSNPTLAIKAEVCSSYLAKIPLDGNNVRRARSTPVDPAGGHRYGSSLKTCESRGARPRRTAQEHADKLASGGEYSPETEANAP